MNNREHFDYLVTIGVLSADLAESRVRLLVEQLLSALKIPDEEGMRLDKSRLTHFGIDVNEPANWASFNVAEVQEFKDGTFLVTIDEACPGACPTLCGYIEKYMLLYGWQVTVQTEW